MTEKELLEQSRSVLHEIIDKLESLPVDERARVMRTVIVWYKHNRHRALREAADETA